MIYDSTVVWFFMRLVFGLVGLGTGVYLVYRAGEHFEWWGQLSSGKQSYRARPVRPVGVKNVLDESSNEAPKVPYKVERPEGWPDPPKEEEVKVNRTNPQRRDYRPGIVKGYVPDQPSKPGQADQKQPGAKDKWLEEWRDEDLEGLGLRQFPSNRLIDEVAPDQPGPLVRHRLKLKGDKDKEKEWIPKGPVEGQAMVLNGDGLYVTQEIEPGQIGWGKVEGWADSLHRSGVGAGEVVIHLTDLGQDLAKLKLGERRPGQVESIQAAIEEQRLKMLSIPTHFDIGRLAELKPEEIEEIHRAYRESMQRGPKINYNPEQPVSPENKPEWLYGILGESGYLDYSFYNENATWSYRHCQLECGKLKTLPEVLYVLDQVRHIRSRSSHVCRNNREILDLAYTSLWIDEATWKKWRTEA